MFYSLKLKLTAKADTKQYRGVEVNKEYPVFVETDKDIEASAAKANIEVVPLERLPERDHANNNPAVHRI